MIENLGIRFNKIVKIHKNKVAIEFSNKEKYSFNYLQKTIINIYPMSR